MGRGDYEALASCFSDISGMAMTLREKQLMCRLAVMISNRLKARSAQYNEQKFLQACKLPKVEGFNC